MPYPILPNDSPNKETPLRTSSRGDDNGRRPSMLDRLTILVATFLYFRYMGKAISTGQKVPREWLKLDVVQRVKTIATNSLNSKTGHQSPTKVIMGETPKKTYKVVDIASGEPITIQ